MLLNISSYQRWHGLLNELNELLKFTSIRIEFIEGQYEFELFEEGGCFFLVFDTEKKMWDHVRKKLIPSLREYELVKKAEAIKLVRSINGTVRKCRDERYSYSPVCANYGSEIYDDDVVFYKNK